MNRFLEKIRKITPESIWRLGVDIKNKFLKYKYLKGKRPYTPGETTKAFPRRRREGFFDKYCIGIGLDVGFGGDPIIKGVEGFDWEHGDAQYLKELPDNSFDFVYSSHTLEHITDPAEAVYNWFRVLKRNGYLILYIPHRDLYEKKKTLPSRFNENHKHFFLIDRDEAPDTIGIIPLIERTLDNYKIIYAKECRDGFTLDDPIIHSNGEYSIEVIVQKK